MADVVDAATRSRMMAAIRGKDTRPEVALRSALHRHGFRFRLHDPALPGRPDIVMKRYRAAVFVHGCFWHRHVNCRLAYNPKSRMEFWAAKFDATVRRDVQQRNALIEKGWRVATVWECSLRAFGTDSVVAQLADWLRGSAATIDIEYLQK